MRGKFYKKKIKGGFFVSLIKIVVVCLVLLFGVYLLRNRDFFINSLGGKGRTTLLFYTEKDSLLAILDTNGSTLDFIAIPGELYTDLPDGYGSYRFGAIYRLGEIDGVGKKLVKRAATTTFAIGIDGVVVMDKSFDFGTEEKNGAEIKKDILGYGFLKDVILKKGSNFGYLMFWAKARNLKPQDIKFFNLRSSDSVSELILADNSKALKFDQYYFDRQIGNLYLKDSQAMSENLKVEIMNGSEVVGLGEKMARYMTNLGVNVLSVSNTDIEPSVCRIKYDEKLKKSYTLYRLVKDLSCSFEVFSPVDNPKADFTVIFGDGFQKKSWFNN